MSANQAAPSPLYQTPGHRAVRLLPSPLGGEGQGEGRSGALVSSHEVREENPSTSTASHHDGCGEEAMAGNPQPQGRWHQVPASAVFRPVYPRFLYRGKTGLHRGGRWRSQAVRQHRERSGARRFLETAGNQDCSLLESRSAERSGSRALAHKEGAGFGPGRSSMTHPSPRPSPPRGEGGLRPQTVLLIIQRTGYVERSPS